MAKTFDGPSTLERSGSEHRVGRLLANDNNIQPMADDSQIVLYQPDESISLHVRIDEAFNTVWLSLDQMAELFGRDRSVIGKHVRTIFNEGELQKESVWAKFAYTASDGKTYQVNFYNLDVIISVGYRVKSVQGTKFRIWATSVLRQYLLQGYFREPSLDSLTGEYGQAYDPY